MVVPSPSCPLSLLPQHLTPPLVVSAQAWRLPSAIVLTPLLRPETFTGTLLSVVVPSPNAPKTPSLRPQHLAAPAAVTAQVNSELVATDLIPPLVKPTTSTGVDWICAEEPLPKKPVMLLPQHLIPPAVVMAQKYSPPALMLWALLAPAPDVLLIVTSCVAETAPTLTLP